MTQACYRVNEIRFIGAKFSSISKSAVVPHSLTDNGRGDNPSMLSSHFEGEKQHSRHSRHFLSKTTTQFLARKDIVNRAPYDHNRHYYQLWCLKNLGRDVGDKASLESDLDGRDWHIFLPSSRSDNARDHCESRESDDRTTIKIAFTFRNRNLSPSFIPGRGRRPRVIIKKEMIKPRYCVRLSCDATVYN